MEYRFENSGITETITFSQENIDEIFLPLLRQMKELQEAKGSRILVLLAAPPGAGKSSLSSFLKYLSESMPGYPGLTVIGMDGFHRYQDYLLSHTITRDGREYTMVDLKGAPETFDLERLSERVRRVAAGEECGWPTYNRLTHNPEEDAITVKGDIILLEGNYLLLDRAGWSQIRNYANLSIFLSADEAMLRRRLIARKISTGASVEKAEHFVDFSDMANVRVCLNESGEADVHLRGLPGDGVSTSFMIDNKMNP